MTARTSHWSPPGGRANLPHADHEGVVILVTLCITLTSHEHELTRELLQYHSVNVKKRFGTLVAFALF
ncbi:MAG: hypothetical protein H6822_24295 [Planctomycetaceae bacterium]|nr:hypothetical protein [Planctomycetales bacterium]MCB9925321.1 hypothetical protein [Planctomycetaceae bacterium]